jgi:starvation-inducible DNA-binding protein
VNIDAHSLHHVTDAPWFQLHSFFLLFRRIVMATATKSEKMFSTRIDLSRDLRERMVELLNQQLADTFDLYSQTKQAHWNVKGAQFFPLHELYDKLAAELAGYADLIAERATALGGLARGTVRLAAAQSQLAEYPLDATAGLHTVETLADRFGALANSTWHAIEIAHESGDVASEDLLTEVVRGLDKALWFLEAHLQA